MRTSSPLLNAPKLESYRYKSCQLVSRHVLVPYCSPASHADIAHIFISLSGHIKKYYTTNKKRTSKRKRNDTSTFCRAIGENLEAAASNHNDSTVSNWGAKNTQSNHVAISDSRTLQILSLPSDIWSKSHSPSSSSLGSLGEQGATVRQTRGLQFRTRLWWEQDQEIRMDRTGCVGER
jgi:hypothetical protein